jgi:hypothetical protein
MPQQFLLVRMNQNISEQSEGNVKQFLVGKEWDGHKVGMAHDLLAEGLMTMSEPQTFTRAFGNEEYNMDQYGYIWFNNKFNKYKHELQ